MPQMKMFQLGDSTFVLNTSGSGIKVLPKPVIILDNSGSMRSIPTYMGKVVSKILKENGYKDNDKVQFITFDSDAHTYNLTVKGLSTEVFRSGGVTNMGESLPELEKVLDEIEDDNTELFIFSDGDISDRIRDIEQYIYENMEKYFGRIRQIHAIRIKTSSYSKPDTRAMSLFHDFSVLPPEMVTFDCVTQEDIFDTLYKNLKPIMNLSKETVVVSSEQGNTVGTSLYNMGKKVTIPVGSSVLIQGDPGLLNVNGELVSLPTVDIKSESDLGTFLTQSRDILKFRMVNKKDNDELFDFLKQLHEKLGTITQEPFTLDVTQNSRNQLAQLANHVRKLGKTNILEECMRLNARKVDKLNSQQAAEFLKQTKSQAIAKRFLKAGEGPEETLFKNLENFKLESSEREIVEDSEGVLSDFVSMSSYADMLLGGEEMAKFYQEGSDVVNMENILKVIGPIGVGLHVRRPESYADPFGVIVDHVFCDSIISSGSINMANTQECQIQIHPSGDFNRAVINAVAPLFPDEISRIAYRHLKEIFEIQTSVGIREQAGIIPNDILGLNTAAIVTLLENDDRSEKTLETLDYLLITNRFLFKSYADFTFGQSVTTLLESGDSPRSVFRGKNDISHPNKLVAFLSCSPLTDKFSDNITNILDALLEFYGFFIVRAHFKDRKVVDGGKILYENSPQKRSVEIEKFMKEYSESLVLPTLSDLFEEESLSLHEVNMIGGEQVTGVYDNQDCMEKLKGTYFYQKVTKFGKVLNFIAHQYGKTYELDSHHLLNLYIACLYNSTDDNLIEVNFKNNNQCYIKSKLFEEFQSKYNTALGEKANQENAVRRDLLLQMLVRSGNLESFNQLLKDGYENIMIQNHTTDLFTKLTNDLYEQHTVNPLLIEKLRILILGRDRDGEIVWNSGNPIDGSLYLYSKIFQMFDEETNGNEWDQLLTDKSVPWVYRTTTNTSTGKPANRHGHWAGLVSYWALGFKTIDEMKRICMNAGDVEDLWAGDRGVVKVSSKFWDKYKEEHTIDKCGCFRIEKK